MSSPGRGFLLHLGRGVLLFPRLFRGASTDDPFLGIGLFEAPGSRRVVVSLRVLGVWTNHFPEVAQKLMDEACVGNPHPPLETTSQVENERFRVTHDHFIAIFPEEDASHDVGIGYAGFDPRVAVDDVSQHLISAKPRLLAFFAQTAPPAKVNLCSDYSIVNVILSSKMVKKLNFCYFYRIGRSSNGRTLGFGPRYRGSSPCLPAMKV